MKIRLTAQVVLSDHGAILAYSVPSDTRGPNGETHFAALLSTHDAGYTWTRMRLQRTFLDGFRHRGYPVWPPEAIIELTNRQSGTQIVFRDEWVPFEPGGESLWRAAQHRNGKWSTSRIRYMDYDGADCPKEIPEITLCLPPTIKGPKHSMLNDIEGL